MALKDEEQKILDVIDGHIRQNGFAAYPVKDGEMLFFTTNTLEKLVLRAKANPDGRVAVFVPFDRKATTPA